MPGTDRLIGFVGIGAMGGPMVRRLAAAGHEVLVFDTDKAHANAVAEVEHVRVAAGLSELGAASITILMLPSSEAVRQTVDLLAPHLAEGGLLVDMGSSDPRSTVELARSLAAGRSLVDAPVSGGLAGAVAGRLTVMFGGTAEQLARCRTIFEALGDNVVHVGAVGMGHAMKALNNLLSAVGLAAACEVMEVGRRYGLDSAVMLDVLNHSTGRNHATETKVQQFVLSGTFASGFALRLMVKDISTAVDLARALDVDCEIGEACLNLWQEAAHRLPPSADQTQIALMVGGLGQVTPEAIR